ncbi:MAG TPA: helix-hairpin-helix domain-containing protein, partial [Pseudonocardiaceae bacterium]|nr:helix-hairpin-helix domain-containing protein [Pseudonocardiaceae bacterium]
RFAITYHRQKRSKRMTASVLDGVPGLGQARRTALLKHFGSLKRLASASVDEISEVPGVGRHTAEAVHAVLSADSGAAAGALGSGAGESVGADSVGVDNVGVDSVGIDNVGAGSEQQ